MIVFQERLSSAKKIFFFFWFIGDVIQSPTKLLRQIKAKWFKYGHCYVPKKKTKDERGCFYYINKDNYKDERADAIERLSYLAKTRGKGYKGKQAKNYSVSRLKAK